jgi:hypothetical protein
MRTSLRRPVANERSSRCLERPSGKRRSDSGAPTKTVRRLLRPGELPALKIRGAVRIDVADLDTPVVFPAQRGGYINLGKWRRDEWKPALRAAGINYRSRRPPAHVHQRGECGRNCDVGPEGASCRSTLVSRIDAGWTPPTDHRMRKRAFCGAPGFERGPLVACVQRFFAAPATARRIASSPRFSTNRHGTGTGGAAGSLERQAVGAGSRWRDWNGRACKAVDRPRRPGGTGQVAGQHHRREGARHESPRAWERG